MVDTSGAVARRQTPLLSFEGIGPRTHTVSGPWSLKSLKLHWAY